MRVATLLLTPDIFVGFCLASTDNAGMPRRFEVTANPLPDDVKVVAVLHHGDGHIVELVLSSATFADVPLNEPLPELPSPVYQVVFDGGRWVKLDAK